MVVIASWGLMACGGGDPDAALRFDGLYCSPDKGETTYRMFLRFCEDKTVSGISVRLTPKEVASILDKSCPECGVGRFVLTGQAIQFTTSFSDGSIDFQGQVDHDQIDLNVHSHYNDTQFQETYTYVQADSGD